MSDYIKREDAIKTLEGWKISGEMILATVPSADVVEGDKAQKEIDYWHDKAQSYEQTILKLSLNKADVVEVVRCKDCKHRPIDTQEEGNGFDYDFPEEYGCPGYCDDGYYSQRFKDDFYCACGERADT